MAYHTGACVVFHPLFSYQTISIHQFPTDVVGKCIAVYHTFQYRDRIQRLYFSNDWCSFVVYLQPVKTQKIQLLPDVNDTYFSRISQYGNYSTYHLLQFHFTIRHEIVDVHYCLGNCLLRNDLLGFCKITYWKR